MTPKENVIPSPMRLTKKEANTTTHPHPPSGARVSEKCSRLDSSSELDSVQLLLELQQNRTLAPSMHGYGRENNRRAFHVGVGDGAGGSRVVRTENKPIIMSTFNMFDEKLLAQVKPDRDVFWLSR